MKACKFLCAVLVAPVLLHVACIPCDCVPPDDMPSVVLGESENGATIQVAAGDRIVVSLTANSSIGDMFSLVEPDAAVLESAGFESLYDHPIGWTGGDSQETWEFVARGPGTAKIRLDYLFRGRPAAEEGMDDRTFEVTVVVDADEAAGPSASSATRS